MNEIEKLLYQISYEENVFRESYRKDKSARRGFRLKALNLLLKAYEVGDQHDK